MLKRVLEAIFPVRQGERQLTFLLFLHNFFAVGAFVAGRSVRDALFLTHGDAANLPWMILASAVAVTIAGLLYTPIAARVRRDRMALASSLFFGGAYVAAFLIEQQSQAPWVYPALYVYVEVMGALSLVQFWTLANELFNAREAKRLYGLIGAGGTVSNILIGLATAKIATSFGASALLVLCGLLSTGAAVAASSAGVFGRQRIFARAASGRPPKKRGGGAASVLGSGHLRTVALLAALTFFTTTVVDFEFKVIAGASLKKDELAAYFGYFYMAVGLLALGFQLFGTSKLLNRAGVVGALAVLPVSLGLGNLGLAIFPALLAATFAKGADALFRYSVNDATTQILYLPAPPQARVAAKAFVDSVVKPAAIGLAGIGLVGYRAVFGAEPRILAVLGFVLCVVWALLLFLLRGQYIASLQANLRSRRLDLDNARHQVADASTGKVLIRALESDDPREVHNALELLPHLDNLQLDHRVEGLLEHPQPNLRIAALSYYAQRRTMRFANSIFRRFDDPEPQVRAAAIDAFCAIGRDKSVKSVRGFLQDPHPGIRAAAVTGMIRYGGLDGVLIAAEALKQLIEHPQPEMRAHAAKVLGAIGVKNFYQPVLELMNDSDPLVRREAVAAAGELRSAEFVLPLLYRTGSPETGIEAVEALAAYGSGIVPTLGKALGNHLETAPVRRGAARVLGKIASPEVVEVITRHLDEPDEELRTRLYRSLAKAVKGSRLMAVDRRQVDAAVELELTRAFRTLAAAEALELGAGPTVQTPRSGGDAAAALLASALTEKVSQTENRLFLLLAVLYPDAGMEAIYAGIRDATAEDAARRRANAVELLDNLLSRDLKKKILPLLDEMPRQLKLRAVSEFVKLPALGREETLTALCRDDSAWVRACALYFAAERRTSTASEELWGATGDGSPVVREMALVGLTRVDEARARAAALRKTGDEAKVVRLRAQGILDSRKISVA